MTSENANCEKPEDHDGLDLTSIIQSLLDVVSYVPTKAPRISQTSMDALTHALNEEVKSWNLDDGHDGALISSVVNGAITSIEFCYPHQPFEVKLALALYSWFFFYIDDRGCEIPVESYQQRLVLGLPSEDPALAHYSETLGTLYNHWDPVCANLMVCSVFDFVNGNILENMPEVNAMTVRRSATNWPTYFRSKTGMAGGFALGIFPKHAHPELTAYIQAIPDIETYQCLANDLLSFYKEELAGETKNYVYNRSKATGMHPRLVLIEMVREVGELHTRIEATLGEEPEALAAWKAFDNGFMAWHLSLQRYKLSELGFGWTIE